MAMARLYPLTFEPLLKERVWGGRKLEQLYGKKLPAGVPVGESWELADRPGDISIINNGPFAGKDLHWLIETHAPELLGGAKLCQGRFPLLIKILDAREKLSLQVHPPAAKAAELGGEPKTELWYIAEAAPGAELYVGLQKGCTREEFTRRLQDGSVADCFHRVAVRAGDAMFLPSGRVHAIGAGLVIFEIQQNSDTTYRVFDWNRPGLDGKPRALHFNESLASIQFDDFEPGLVSPEPLRGSTCRRLLVNHELFSVELATLEGGQTLSLLPQTMQIIGIVTGHLQIQTPHEDVELTPGQFCLIPASLESAVLRAQDAVTCLCGRPGQ